MGKSVIISSMILLLTVVTGMAQGQVLTPVEQLGKDYLLRHQSIHQQ